MSNVAQQLTMEATMLHTFLEQPREDLGSTTRVLIAKELPEVRGWRMAGEPEVLAAIELWNEKKRQECKARILAELKI